MQDTCKWRTAGNVLPASLRPIKEGWPPDASNPASIVTVGRVHVGTAAGGQSGQATVAAVTGLGQLTDTALQTDKASAVRHGLYDSDAEAWECQSDGSWTEVEGFRPRTEEGTW